jgi:hypothetical protein
MELTLNVYLTKHERMNACISRGSRKEIGVKVPWVLKDKNKPTNMIALLPRCLGNPLESRRLSG